MKIQPIVEGHGEVTAVPILLRRLRDACGVFAMDFLVPIRSHRSQLTQEAPLRGLVRRALAQRNPDGLLILCDADDDCPRETAPRIQGWASDEAGEIGCVVVLANREYEAWFLASLTSLRGWRGIGEEASSHPQPESVRGAKARLSGAMRQGKAYAETVDQAALSARFDLAEAYEACRSFRRLVNAFGTLAQRGGATLPAGPPSSWLAGA